jgi:uncharacterized protein (DUF1800 family)
MANISYAEAAHLMRRMGFGAGPTTLGGLAGLDRETAVDSLLNFSKVDNTNLESLLQSSFRFSNPNDPVRFNRSELQRWWFTRMVFTRRPFEEKLTLFWHNHFATAASKVPDVLMFIQNEMLRKNGLGRFDDLLLSVAKDPAMLVWLDGITSISGAPNENFARELQELFTMGIKDFVTGEANYTQDDVREIARAFTGLKINLPNPSKPFNFVTFLNTPEHDYGPKTIYGQTANYTGDDVVTLIAARRATARFLVKKLFNFFVYSLNTDGSDSATVEKFADVYMNNDHSIEALLRAIFTSDEFFSQRALFGLVKSPVELVVGAALMLGARYRPGTFRNNPNPFASFSYFLGQELFNPPDVSGWTHGLGWISTATLLNRYTFADYLNIIRSGYPLMLPPGTLKRYAKGNAGQTVTNFLNVLGPLSLDADTVAALVNYLETDDQGNPVTFVPNDATVDKKVRGLVHQIMCLSEFHLN